MGISSFHLYSRQTEENVTGFLKDIFIVAYFLENKNPQPFPVGDFVVI